MSAWLSPDGDPIVGWGSYGPVCGYGPLYAAETHRLYSARELAERDLAGHREGCVAHGGYSDRRLCAVDAMGYLWRLDIDDADQETLGSWVRASGGQAARYTADDLAACLLGAS